MNVSCPQCSTVYRVDPAKVPAGGVRARCSTCSGIIQVGMLAHSSHATPARPTPSRPTPSRPTPSQQTPRTGAPGPFVPPARQMTPPSQPLGASLPPLRPTPRTSWPVVGAPVPVAPRAATPPSPQTAQSAPTLEEEAAVPSLAPTLSIPALSVPSLTPPSRQPLPATTLPAAGSPPQPASATPASLPMGPGDRRPVNPFLTRDPSIRAKRLARALVSDMIAYYPAKHAEGLEKGTLKDLFRDEIKRSYEEYIAQVGADFARTTTHFQESLNEVLGAGKKIF